VSSPPAEHDQPAPKERRWIGVALLALLVVGAAAVLWAFLNQDTTAPVATPATPSPTTADAPDPQSTSPAVILELEGEGDTATDEFGVAPGWEIHWETSGERFRIDGEGEEDLGTLVEHTGGGGGSTYPDGAGRIRLQILSDGPWSIEVIGVPLP